ncbi:MAG: hypothetical protein E4H00_01560 [Myxococcales bacterium]|nr:MAG: hypothetical protein E4H00_01560 [Myxococcales bacterium]
MTSTRFNLAIAALSLSVACGDANATMPSVVCDDPPALDADEALDLYLAAWTEDDSFERTCMVQRSLAADAVLIDAGGPIAGRSAVAARVDERVASLLAEGATREAAGPISLRHEEARFAWATANETASEIERGEDWLEFDEAGLLSRIHILAGSGEDVPIGDQFIAWQRAWNARNEASRAEDLSEAATQDVRFTDLLTDVRGREALGAEIGRQQETLDGELRLDDRVEVFATMDGQPILIRQSAQITLRQGGPIHLTNYVRLEHGRIQRLSGFPTP